MYGFFVLPVFVEAFSPFSLFLNSASRWSRSLSLCICSSSCWIAEWSWFRSAFLSIGGMRLWVQVSIMCFYSICRCQPFQCDAWRAGKSSTISPAEKADTETPMPALTLIGNFIGFETLVFELVDHWNLFLVAIFGLPWVYTIYLDEWNTGKLPRNHAYCEGLRNTKKSVVEITNMETAAMLRAAEPWRESKVQWWTMANSMQFDDHDRSVLGTQESIFELSAGIKLCSTPLSKMVVVWRYS